MTSTHFTSASCLHCSDMESCPHSHSAPPCRTWPTWWLYRTVGRCWRRCLTAATGPHPPGIPSRRPCRARWTGSTPLAPSCSECARSSPSTRGRSENCHERWQNSLMPDAGDLLSRRRGEEEWRLEVPETQHFEMQLSSNCRREDWDCGDWEEWKVVFVFMFDIDAWYSTVSWK